MPRLLVCSTPRVGSVAYSEKLSQLLKLPLAFQPWEPYAFNKQPEAVKNQTLAVVDSRNVLIHSHIHACVDKLQTMDAVIYIGRKDRVKQAWSFFVAFSMGKMQNLNIENIVIPEPKPEIVDRFIGWINLWDDLSKNNHRVFYEDLELTNEKWQQCQYKNIRIENFEAIEKKIKDGCLFKIE